MLGPVIEDLAVDLIAEHDHLGVPFEPGDEAVELVPWDDTARRIGRAVDDHQAGARGDLVQHLVCAEREPCAFVQRDRHRGRSGKPDDALVNREARVGIKDLDPRFSEHQDREEHRHLAAGDDQDQLRRNLDPVPTEEIGRDRRAQLRDAVGGRVPVMAVSERLATGLDDVLGRREIRLADTEIDDRAALRRERIGASQHLERGLGAEDAHAPGHLQHRFLPGDFALAETSAIGSVWRSRTG